MILCSLSLYHKVEFIPGPDKWRTSVPAEPPSFSCKKKGLSHPFQLTRGWHMTHTVLSLTLIMLFGF